jgi:5'-nucleotidase
MAAYLRDAARGNENNTIITLMGDVVGASISESSLLNHEPTILFLNSLANTSCSFTNKMSPYCNIVATIGNHEFDHGQQAIFDMYQGSNLPPKNNWINLPTYPGASFPVISANIIDDITGKPMFTPYVIKQINGIPVAFVGAILKHAASSMLPENAQGVTFLDEADAINHYLPEIRKQGVKIVIAIIHEGGDSITYEGDTRKDTKVNGIINNIVERLDDGVEVVMAGHTHRFLNAFLPNHNGYPVLVTQAGSYSAAFADVTLRVDRDSKRVLDKSARIVYTFADQYPGTAPDRRAEEIVNLAKTSVAPMVNQKVGTLTDSLSRFQNPAGESALGNLIADAFRDVMNADIGITNSTSIRANLQTGTVNWGALYTVQPFENPVVKMTLSGQDILDLLVEQWEGAHKNILQISGMTYLYNEKLPLPSRIISAQINGAPLDPAKIYTIGVNTYLAYGGSGFNVFKRAKIIERGTTDLQTLITHIQSLPQPFTAKIDGRITSV